MKKRSFALILSLALVLVCIVGGTLAWLTDKTAEVKNTFTTSDIDIKLEETLGGENKEFKMVPGYTIAKDPKVTVLAGSEKCYLFVKLEKSANFDKFLTYEMADGWAPLTDVPNVFYRVVDANTANTEFKVLKNNQVTVQDAVTKADMDDLTSDTYPTLTVTAYASQFMKDNNTEFLVTEAWENIS